MHSVMEDFDDDVTVIQLRGTALEELMDPPALPIPLIRRKDDPDRNIVLRLTAERMRS